jgi:DAACS family dicarboxylate/amino acid:cation (Na+ or H+) symporter
LPHLPLAVRVVIGVVLGTIVGLALGTAEYEVLGLFSYTTEDLGRIGLLVVRVLKMLALPLVLFAILDAIARTEVSGRMGGRLILICLMNVCVAFAIGLTLMNLIEPGESWHGKLAELGGPDLASPKQAPPGTSLSPLENFEKWIPETVVQPVAEGNVISVVLLALLAGAAIRRTRRTSGHAAPIETVVSFIEGAYGVLVQMLSWVIEIVPFAVFGVLAHVVGKAGLGMFVALSGFLGVILLGFALHALIYYPMMAWLVGKKPPRVYLGRGANAIVTGLSTNSSLATVPITLGSLDSMGVSPSSSRLAACIGTNLNNDGITLYEAMAALFLAQALGYDLSAGAQVTIVLSSLMAGIGVAGIPEAGLVVLPLVLAAAGLPEPVVAAVLPLVFSVDWILARCRSAVNVMSDMLVAILLDRWSGGADVTASRER